ncbi:MAG TPA: helical backbone metal receptor, partial [Acidimicrobiia bacterium]|nr:helical backbone metal receptor [Acidimicrobiia bacterium]
ALARALAVDVPEPFADWTAWMTATGRSQQAVAFVSVWRRPYMSLAADTYGSSLLAHVGIGNAFADAGERYPEVDLAVVAQRDPDIALLPSEPYEFTAAHLPEVQAALPQSRVALVDGRDLFWWGIRTPAAVERLSTLA